MRDEAGRNQQIRSHRRGKRGRGGRMGGEYLFSNRRRPPVAGTVQKSIFGGGPGPVRAAWPDSLVHGTCTSLEALWCNAEFTCSDSPAAEFAAAGWRGAGCTPQRHLRGGSDRGPPGDNGQIACRCKKAREGSWRSGGGQRNGKLGDLRGC